MKINDANALPISLGNIARSGYTNIGNVRSSSAGSAGPASGDEIALSSHSRLSAQALTAGEAARSARISQLRELYVNGQHTVDSNELSGAIINAHLSSGG